MLRRTTTRCSEGIGWGGEVGAPRPGVQLGAEAPEIGFKAARRHLVNLGHRSVRALRFRSGGGAAASNAPPPPMLQLYRVPLFGQKRPRCVEPFILPVPNAQRPTPRVVHAFRS